jgi:hypothetical protein
MATIKFDEARQMATDAEAWMKTVSDFITDPNNPRPDNLYSTQKLAFEIDKTDLETLITGDRIIGVLGFENNASSLTVVLVSTDIEGRPSEQISPRQTWPLLKKMNELPDVLNTYLTPKD